MLAFAPPAMQGAWDHRPSVSSPLSSSPIRASSPLSPANQNTLSQRQTQSSPIQPSKFRFASRPSKPNPLLRKREDAQQARRGQFLQQVRQKSADKAWNRRDIEGQFIKSSLLADLGRLSYDAPALSEADIDDAIEFGQVPADEQDEMMDDEPVGDDQFEAMIAFFEEYQSANPAPPSDVMSDDDYDDIFAELISQQATAQDRAPQETAGPDSQVMDTDMS